MWGQLQEKFTPTEYVIWAREVEVALPPELESLSTRKDWRQQCESLEAELARKERELIETQKEFARLTQRIRELEAESTDDHALAELRPKERSSLLKIIYGVAVDKFDYDPNKGKSSAPKLISDACQRTGVHIDDETVRKWLRIAAEEMET